MFEIYILLTMSIVMFGCSIVILYLGYKRGTPNIILWTLFPLVRGLHWLVEAIADYYEEILEIELFIFTRLELFTAFCSSFILLAVCLDHNGMIRRPIGKIIALAVSIPPLYFIAFGSGNLIEEIDDDTIWLGSGVTTETFRFSYGFILPIISIIVLVGIFFYYYYHTKKGHINYNPKVKRSTFILVVLIFLFSFFEGFDYYEESELEIIFIGLRGITLAFFVIIPLIVILSQDLGLQKFFLIEESGALVFAYNFQEKSVISVEDDISHLTSGFVSAIMEFSNVLSQKESGYLAVQLSYLYYIILKTKSKIYAIQTILTNRHLKNKFLNTIENMDILTSTIHQSSDIALGQVQEILETNFSTFL